MFLGINDKRERERMGQKAHVAVGRTFRDVKGQWRVGWATTNSKWVPRWSFGSILLKGKKVKWEKEEGREHHVKAT